MRPRGSWAATRAGTGISFDEDGGGGRCRTPSTSGGLSTTRAHPISPPCFATKSHAAVPERQLDTACARADAPRSARTLDARYLAAPDAARPFSSTSRGAWSFQSTSLSNCGWSETVNTAAVDDVTTMRFTAVLHA